MSLVTPPVPYWRLSSFYFFYFALLGAWMPFWPLYLQEHQFSATDIGYLAGIVMATKIFAPSLWSWISHYFDKRVLLIRWGAFAACLMFAGIYIDHSFWALAAVVTGFSFFWNAILAEFEVLTLDYLEGRSERYAQIRLWGSISFILVVAGLGWCFDWVSINSLPAVLLLLLIGIWLTSLLVGEPAHVASSAKPRAPIKEILKQPAVIAFLVCCFLQQLSHGPYYTFFSVYLVDHGYNNTAIGLMWSLGVLAEVLVFIIMHRLLLRFSLRSIMLASLLLSAVRWLLIGLFADSLVILLIAQCLHAASFGTFHAFAVEMVRRSFPGHEGQGMALYSGLSFGAGGAIGAVASGWLWLESPPTTFVAAAVICMIAFAIGLRVKLAPALKAP